MAAQIIDGKALAEKLRQAIAIRCESLKTQGIIPCLAVILLGDDPASLSYVSAKEKALAAAGMISRDFRLSATVSETQLLGLIDKLNHDPAVHGILVQLPLPPQIAEQRIVEAIQPAKDVDGFCAVSVGNLVLGRAGFIPCTPKGIIALLHELAIPTDGAQAVVVGRSNIVGKPLANLLIRRDINATVTVCHTGTRNLAALTQTADILVAAVGQPGLIRADMVKAGAVVVDVGVNRLPDPSAKKGYRLVGDVDFEAVKQVAGYLTPVPGGVGPLTIAMLLQNLVEAAEQHG